MKTSWSLRVVAVVLFAFGPLTGCIADPADEDVSEAAEALTDDDQTPPPPPPPPPSGMDNGCTTLNCNNPTL